MAQESKTIGETDPMDLANTTSYDQIPIITKHNSLAFKNARVKLRDVWTPTLLLELSSGGSTPNGAQTLWMTETVVESDEAYWNEDHLAFNAPGIYEVTVALEVDCVNNYLQPTYWPVGDFSLNVQLRDVNDTIPITETGFEKRFSHRTITNTSSYTRFQGMATTETFYLRVTDLNYHAYIDSLITTAATGVLYKPKAAVAVKRIVTVEENGIPPGDGDGGV